MGRAGQGARGRRGGGPPSPVVRTEGGGIAWRPLAVVEVAAAAGTERGGGLRRAAAGRRRQRRGKDLGGCSAAMPLHQPEPHVGRAGPERHVGVRGAVGGGAAARVVCGVGRVLARARLRGVEIVRD